ncbi:MAG: flagellar basal body P-ring formation protein FlgA [Gammaproteobacteria bacterium]|nr:flagellar basal body P-ring formation protein FlgA [Gammaproteobacteria bacterium]
MTPRLHTTSSLCLALLLGLGAARAATTAPAAIESLDRIRDAATEHARTQLRQTDATTIVRVGQIDPRLRLPRCETPLTVQAGANAGGIGNSTVSVRCDGARPWSLLVPIRVSQEREVVVLTRAIGAGETIPPDALALTRLDTATLGSGYFTGIDQVTGAVARRAFAAGMVLHSRLVQPPAIVRRGEQVRIAADNPTISVVAAGMALRDGRLGERIPVRNLSSERIIEGTVAASGIVRVPGLIPVAP